MRLKFALSTAVALLIATQAERGWADKGQGKSGKKDTEVTANFNKQFEWENRVVGPREGLDHDKLAAIQEKGRRDDEARKKEPPKKVERAAGLNEAGSVALPTMDIEKPAAAKKPASKKVVADAAPAPRRKDSLDNLLDEQGVKPNNPSGGGTGSNAGLDNLFASDDKSGSHGGSARKGNKKTKRR
jgi:hypothetical protein